MLQQTPVARVLPVWQQWMARWPTPADLAVAPAGEAVRAWGRLGYPRRALRLHACATLVVTRHGGQVPADVGRSAGTARGRRLHRGSGGRVRAPPPHRGARHQRAPGARPGDARRGATAHPGPTEIERARRRGAAAGRPGGCGPVVCRADGARRAGVHGARTALCELPGRGPLPLAGCRPPVRRCRAAHPDLRRHRPSGAGPPARRAARRQRTRCPEPGSTSAWHDPVQRDRALDGLVADGLVEPAGADRFALPGTAAEGVRERTGAAAVSARSRTTRSVTDACVDRLVEPQPEQRGVDQLADPLGPSRRDPAAGQISRSPPGSRRGCRDGRPTRYGSSPSSPSAAVCAYTRRHRSTTGVLSRPPQVEHRRPRAPRRRQ